MIGIYKIENLINHKVYIGQSIDIKRRFNAHKATAFNINARNYQYPLYRAIRKYGLENFSFQVIEECSQQELNKKENYWILYYDSCNKGYNQSYQGNNNIKNFSTTVKGIIYDLENSHMTQQELADKWKVHINTIYSINTGKTWRQPETQYPLRSPYHYLGKGKTFMPKKYYCIDCGVQITKKAIRCQQCNLQHKTIALEDMPVTRDELKNLIRNKPFTYIGKKYGVTDNAIRKWCDKFNLPRKKSEIKNISDEEWRNI